MKLIVSLLMIACAGVFIDCANVPPQELLNARQAYRQASEGQASRLAPAELHKAQAALDIAEKAFQDDAKSFQARDLAYVADRKAKMAEALAVTVAENATTAQANKDYQSTQTEIVKNTKEDLAASERSTVLRTEQLATEQSARFAAENRAADAKAKAVRVKESTDAEALRVKDSTDAEARNVKGLSDAEARRVKDLADAEARRAAEQKIRDNNTIFMLEKGKKVVLRGVNFENNKATLTNESESILMRAYNALVAKPDVQVEISGHTDNVGSRQYNQSLSLQRAQAVRNWLVEKGIASNRMKTVGKGQNEPVASNTTDAGRSENRRIEFFVQQ